MIPERKTETSVRPLHKGTVDFLGSLYDVNRGFDKDVKISAFPMPNIINSEFTEDSLGFPGDSGKDLVIYKVGDLPPVAIKIDRNGKKKMALLEDNSEFYRINPVSEGKKSIKLIQEVGRAVNLLNSKGIALDSGCASEAGNVISKNLDKYTDLILERTGKPAVAAKGLVINTEYIDEKGDSQTASIVFSEDTVIIPVERGKECDHVAIIPWISEEDWEQMQKKAGTIEKKEKGILRGKSSPKSRSKRKTVLKKK